MRGREAAAAVLALLLLVLLARRLRLRALLLEPDEARDLRRDAREVVARRWAVQHQEPSALERLAQAQRQRGLLDELAQLVVTVGVVAVRALDERRLVEQVGEPLVLAEVGKQRRVVLEGPFLALKQRRVHERVAQRSWRAAGLTAVRQDRGGCALPLRSHPREAAARQRA